MRRIGKACLVVFPLLLSACGGSGGRSPSEPPGGGEPVALEGSWSGTITVTGQGTCTVTLDVIRDGQSFLGNWQAQCANGQTGNGLASIDPFIANQVVILALSTSRQTIFGGCGWSSISVRDSNRLRGDWGTPQNCAGGPELRGRIDLTKR